MPIFVSGALQASVMTGLHVCWGLLCSEALEKRSWPLLASVTLSHMVRNSGTYKYNAKSNYLQHDEKSIDQSAIINI